MHPRQRSPVQFLSRSEVVFLRDLEVELDMATLFGRQKCLDLRLLGMLQDRYKVPVFEV